MKKLTYKILAASTVLSFLVTAKADVTVTVADDGVSNIGTPGTFYWALTNCPPGQTIKFAIPGAGPHFLQVPPAGFPIIYQKHGITIDGYSQPGAVANSNPITGSNNAQIKIVIDGRNGNGRDLDYYHYDGTLAKSDPPINNTAMALDANPTAPGEFAVLMVYRSTNVTVKGLAFLSDNLDGVLVTGSGYHHILVFASDYGLDTTIKDALEYTAGSSRNGHVAGCWFDINPTNTSKSFATMSTYPILFPRHKGDDGPIPAGNATLRPNIPAVGMTIGVAPGSANPRAEFNVMVAAAFHVAGEPLRLRISGNFIGVMPDGVTPYDMSAENPTTAYVWSAFSTTTCEFGRYGETFASSPTEGQPMVIGTDGDGVNDADEGNLWGPIGGAVGSASLTAHGPALIHWYRSANNTFLIAGNRWGIANDGTIWTNSAFFISGVYLSDLPDGNSKLFFGSDFASSRSAATIAAQANHFYNNLPIGIFGAPPATTTGIVPFIEYENPSVADFPSTNACISLRGNVMAGNGLGPVYYANNAGTLLTRFTNFYSMYLDTNVTIIPTLNVGSSVFPNLVGTFAPGVAPFTHVIIDVYQLDPYGWTNGQKFALTELTDYATYTNGFPQGKKYLGSFPVANSGSFSVDLTGLDLGPGAVTVTANYSVSPAGTALARTMTSEFSMPITLNWPFITTTQSGGNLVVAWDPALGNFRVQTNSSVASPGTWGDFTVGTVAPPVSVPVGTGNLFIRLKNP